MKRIVMILFCVSIIFGIYFFMSPAPTHSKASLLINSDPLTKDLNQRGVASTDKKNRHKRRKSTLLIKLNDDATTQQIAALKELYDDYDLRHEKNLLNGKAVRVRIFNKVHENNEEQIAKLLLATGAVQFAEPDYTIPPAFVPNDSLYSQQWHHPVIHSDTAWNYTQGNSTVIVAVCDAGFDVTHPDLAAHFLKPGYNTVKDNSEIDNINDHGTATSGIIAAIGNNRQGVAGLAWQIRLLPIQISNVPDGTSTYSDVAECIRYASDHGAKVVNLSYDSTYTSSLVSEAALAFRQAGGVVVVAAGNSTIDISAWGRSPNLMVVGATDSSDKLTWFSNFGMPVDVVAPGQDLYSTTSGGQYTLVSGTSFSTPVVSGTIALLYSLNPNFSADQIENFILSTTDNVGLPVGRLNLGATTSMAYKAITTSPPPAPIILDNLAANLSDNRRQSKGKWCTSNQSGYFGSNSVYSCGSGTDSYRFIPTIPAKQDYTVFIRYLSNPKLSDRVPIIIKSFSGTIKKMINMRSGGGAWVQVGKVTFSAGVNNYVEITDTGGTANVDGIKFEPAS